MKDEMNGLPTYLDYNATTPLDPRVAAAMQPFLQGIYGNPSSSHPYGVEARRAVEDARRDVAEMLGCSTDEIVFTGGGSEANNMALKGAADARRKEGRHIVISAVEHPAVVEPGRYLERQGYQLTVVPVDETGRVDPADVERAMRPGTILVSVMHANNEVGTVQPISEIAAIAHRHGALMHTDAAQSVGKIPVHVEDVCVDLLSVAGHKLYAPKGVGALYIRRGIKLEPYLHGAPHESGRRAGTENVLGIVGLGRAAQLVREEGASVREHFHELRGHLLSCLEQALGQDLAWRINGHPIDCLPNTVSISFKGIEANILLATIQDRVAASAGAACHAGSIDVSPVLKAMRVPLDYAMGTVRLSLGRMTTADEIEHAVTVMVEAVRAFTARG